MKKIITGGTAVIAAGILGALGVNAAQVSAPSTAPSGRMALTDVVVARDVRDLVRSSSLVVIGTPVGEPREVVLESGDSADYFQEVAVESTLKGRPAETVTVVRNGLYGDIEAESDHLVGGALEPGRQVLFLMPGGTPDSFSIVGHFQGAVDFGTSTAEGSEFPELNGKDEAQLAQLVKATPDRSHHDD
jgi:hypothetical protein